MDNMGILLLFDFDGPLVCANEKPGFVSHGAGKVPLRKRMKERAIELGVPGKAYKDVENRMAPIYNRTRDVVSDWRDRDRANFVMSELNRLFIEQEEEEHKGCSPMPTAAETLRYFKERGARIGVVTNTSESEFLNISKLFSMYDYVDEYTTRDQVNYLKPHHEPTVETFKKFGFTATSRPRKIRNVFYVGNDVHDARSFYSACKRLGTGDYLAYCGFILINTGGYNEKEISYMRPERVITLPYELMFIIPEIVRYGLIF